MMGYGIVEDDIKVFEWYEKAASKGSTRAQAFKRLADVQFAMALAYKSGKEKAKDMQMQSLNWAIAA